MLLIECIQTFERVNYQKPARLILGLYIAKELAWEMDLPTDKVKAGDKGSFRGIPYVVSAVEPWFRME